MSLLFSILYAAHANGTHHKLALDALRFLPGEDAEDWRRVFLKHARLYLEGSKAPDKEFKDFKNHVLHVRDGYWGGAPERAEAWYARTVEALKREDWPEAVYAAGILSHYYTDPIHPFHTAQSDAESNIHRAVEWSISKSYGELWREGTAHRLGPAAALPDGSSWLADMVCRGAELSNRSYETLIAHYDFTRGVVTPEEGLDKTGREATGALLVYAAESFALVLHRAIIEAAVRPPQVALTAETVLAGLAMPLKWIVKRMSDAAERRQVEAMYDELKAFGRVEATLPEDDRTIRDLYAREVLAPRVGRQKEARARRLGGAPAPAISSRKEHPARPPAALAGAVETPEAQRVRGEVVTVAPELLRPLTPPKIHLAAEDDVEAAPSIGPRMAERLRPAGVVSVDDLLGADPEALAATLGDSRIKAETIRDWQDQARLVMTVPGLRGGAAQLLVGAGFRSAAEIAETDAADLSSALLTFAATPAGERILRSGEPPDLERIKSWVDAARLAVAA